jgi:hypothetical protein
MAEKIISFKVKDTNGEMKNPRWVEAKTQNDTCPQCANKMVVIMGANPGQEGHFLYAFCLHCEKVFIAE